MLALGFIAGPLQGLLSDNQSLFIGNCCITAALLAIWRGCRQIADMPPLRSIEAAAFVILNGIVFWFTFIDLNIYARLQIGSAVVLAICSVSTAHLWRAKSLRRFRAVRLLIGCLALTSLLFLVRIIAIINHPPVVNYMTPPAPAVDALLISLAIYIAMAVGMCWLTFERMADEMDRRNQALELARQAERQANNAKSAFLANMSNEIRTPMNGILGCTEILLDMSPSAEQKPYLDMLRDAEKLLLTIINDILDFSKLETAQFTLEHVPVELPSIVRGCLDLVRSLATEKGLSLEVALDPALPVWLMGDPARLRQILLNLLNNAVKFTQTGGVWLRISADKGKGAVRFAVSDTGIGVPEERRHLLFQDFSQAHNSGHYGGTGLGLAICQRLVTAMGGTIGMESEAGGGSLFWFTLPLIPAEIPVSRAETGAETGSSPSAKVLVAEDVKVNQVIMERLLTRAGHEVTLVENGAAALAAVQEKPFDLIFMDMRMPVMDGVEATESIRKLAKPAGAIPIIGLTANATPEDAARCREAGMNEHLVKPVDRATLLKAVARWSVEP
ncbi:MAG TPA: ATP-binding protein [Magnetospirillaceae bacterium]|nr:ATP-binding protein [Magnetospirillaceae bacterium]